MLRKYICIADTVLHWSFSITRCGIYKAKQYLRSLFYVLIRTSSKIPIISSNSFRCGITNSELLIAWFHFANDNYCSKLTILIHWFYSPLPSASNIKKTIYFLTLFSYFMWPNWIEINAKISVSPVINLLFFNKEIIFFFMKIEFTNSFNNKHNLMK